MASFFEKIGNGVSEAGSALSQKAKDMSEQSRLTAAIADAETQKEDCFKTMGQMIYTYKKNPESDEPGFDNIVQKIDGLDDSIQSMKKDLNNLKGIMLCPNCHAEIPVGSAFCTFCGAQIEQPSICKNCGKPIPVGAMFCEFCGQKVE